MNEKKVIPLRKPKKEMDFKERVEKYEQYSKDPKEFHKIFTELDCKGGRSCRNCLENGSNMMASYHT